MDCCESEVNSKGGKTMDIKQFILWAVIAILGLAVIYVLFFQGVGNVATAGQTAGSGMVGGC